MLSFGFYNSKGSDRKYDAEQFGAMFNGLIADGVFAHYKDALKVTAGSGNRKLVVKPGRAWFNGTWTEVDDDGHSIYLMGSAVETTYFVYLAVNKSDRKNTIAWYSSIANNDPEKGLYFYLLAQVTVPGGATKISDSMITDTRGSDLCPYVTGIMETVSFEELVKQVCGDNWQDWLGAYEAGITTGVQNAIITSERALDEVKSMKAYAVESEDVGYIWAKFEAVLTGGGGFEWATDSVHTELSDPPMPMCLFRDLTYVDLGPGFKPNISLNAPYVADGETEVKAIPAVTQSKVWREYPYFWEGGASFGTEVLRYDDLQRVVVNVGGTASEKYRYRVSRLVHIPVTYEPGAYIGTVSADNATAYPRDGYKDGYYYRRFAAKAEDVSFYYPGLSAKNVRDAIIEIVRTGGNGSGSAMSVKEVEELPPTGIKGVLYVVKKSGDTDASEYLWLDRWEKVGGSDSLHNVVQSSWAQNDHTQPDYVKDRTHWEENNQTVHPLDEKFIPASIPRMDDIPELDDTLTQSGKAADAKAVGDALGRLSGQNVDYTTLTNKPQINGVTLEGNKTTEDLGISTPTTEQVSTAVQAYLAEHPEATTTVQDGSITPAKFSKPTAERLKFNLYAIGKRIISKEYSKIVLIGDSITDGYGGTGYNGSQTGDLSTNTAGYCWANVFKKYIEDKHGVPVENKGMYGTMAAAQVSRAKTYLSGGELVIWLTGTNNRISVDSYGDYVSNVGQYISDLQSRCADLVVMSCVPAVESNEKARYVTSAEICEVLVTETAGKAFFVDMRKEFARYCEIFGYTIDSVMADGLHPNNTGYWIMFRLLCDNIGIPISTFVSYKYGAEWWGGHGGDTTEKTLTSISATYSGGSVPVGTAVSALTGIVVTAHYSDGTSETVTGYTLSGTISEGGNNVVVSYGGKTTTFFVTGVMESGSEYVSVFPDHVDECVTPMQETNNFVVSAEIPVGTISKVKISSKIDGVYRLYFATKGGDNAYTVTQVEELNVSIGINTIDTNIEIAQPCYLIVTGEGARFYFKEGLSDYQPMKSLSYRKNTPVLVGDTFTENSETKNCYIGVWLGMAKS